MPCSVNLEFFKYNLQILIQTLRFLSLSHLSIHLDQKKKKASQMTLVSINNTANTTMPVNSQSTGAVCKVCGSQKHMTSKLKCRARKSKGVHDIDSTDSALSSSSLIQHLQHKHTLHHSIIYTTLELQKKNQGLSTRRLFSSLLFFHIHIYTIIPKSNNDETQWLYACASLSHLLYHSQI